MVSDKIASNAVGGKTARACDSCVRKRARWYCAADDAFLCQACDSSVHSANPLARRHERVRLKTASNKAFDLAPLDTPIPSWHRGITKKARTPRQGKHANHQTPKSEEEPTHNSFPLVPEIGFHETSHDDNEDQLLYRVPIYDPFLAELCTSTTNSNEAAEAIAAASTFANDAQSEYVNNGSSDSKAMIAGFCHDDGDDDNLHGFLPSDLDLAEFAADVESLLGRGLENESFGIEELGLIDCKESNNSGECSFGSGLSVKLEDEEETPTVAACHFDMDIDLTREPFELNFDYDSPTTAEEEEEKAVARMMVGTVNGGEYEEEDGKKKKKKKNNKLLRLDYEAVITAWGDSQRCPWTTGTRPDLDECWPDFMGTCGTEVHYPYGEMSGMGGNAAMGDGGREARVSRYREKRRTRLFSKKIRYEVRKLNAEKRPRMKGRFVKRSSFAVPGFPLLGK